MELDIKKAFLLPFSEKKWFTKLIFPFIISACFLVFDKNLHINKLTQMISIFCLIIPYLILWGFWAQFQHNEIHSKSEILPILHNKIKDYLTNGLKLAGISLLYTIFFAVILLPISIIFFIFKANLIILTLLIILCICLLVFFVLSLIFSQCSYADNFCFPDAFKFKYILKLIANVKFEIFILLLVSIILGAILKLILMFTNILLILYPVFRVFLKLASLNLVAQMYKIAKKRLDY